MTTVSLQSKNACVIRSGSDTELGYYVAVRLNTYIYTNVKKTHFRNTTTVRFLLQAVGVILQM